MRTFLIALVTLSPLVTWAQPLAPADSALIDDLIAAGRFDTAVQSSAQMMQDMVGQMPMFESLLDDYSPEATIDSIYAAFARDYRAEELQEAITVLRHPDVEALVEFERNLDGGYTGFQAELEAVLMNPGAYVLADSALAAEYVASMGWSERMGTFMTSMMGRMASLFPGAETEAADAGLSVEAFADSIVTHDVRPTMDAQFLVISRYTLKDIDKAAVRTMTDFYASEAGTYYLDTAWAGSMAAAEPLIDSMMDAFSEMFQAFGSMDTPTVEIDDCKKGSECEASGDRPSVRPPPPPPAVERE